MITSILLVEDLEDHRAMLRRRLERAGFEVDEARDGAEAVAKAMSFPPDVVIMDISMPRVDGIEAWRMICERCAEPPAAIAVTATTIADVRATCLEIGFSDYLTKPIDFAELTAAIAYALETRRRASAA